MAVFKLSSILTKIKEFKSLKSTFAFEQNIKKIQIFKVGGPISIFTEIDS